MRSRAVRALHYVFPSAKYKISLAVTLVQRACETATRVYVRVSRLIDEVEKKMGEINSRSIMGDN